MILTRDKIILWVRSMKETGELEDVMTTELLELKSGSGRPKAVMLDSLSLWHGEIYVSEIVVLTRDILENRGLYR